MNFSSLRPPRWLTFLVGSITAMLAATWVIRHRKVWDIPIEPTTSAAPRVPISAQAARNKRRSLSLVTATIASATLAIAALIFQSPNPEYAPPLVAVGAFGLWGALWLCPPALPDWNSKPHRADSFSWSKVVAGVGCITLLTISNLPGQQSISIHIQFGLLVTGIGLAVWGLGGRFTPVDRNIVMVLGAVTVIALVMRVAGLDSTIRFFIDEANFTHALGTLRNSNPPLLSRFSGIAAFPWVYPYLESVTTGLFGRNLVGLRMVSAVLGTLTVPAVYLLAGGLFSKRVGLVAALALATFPPHIHFSRIGMNNIADPLFGTLALGWLTWGWRTGRRNYFALAGGALGLTQYFYDGGRLLYPTLVTIWLVGCVLCARIRKTDGRVMWRSMAVMLAAALIVAAPIYVVSASYGQPFSQRYEQEGTRLAVMNMPDFVQQMWETFLLYVQTIDNSFYYLGTTPLLLVYSAAPFLIGLVYALWRAIRLDYGGWLLLLWLVLTAGGNALLASPLWSARYVVAFPALVVVIALGLDLIYQLFVGRELSRQRFLWAVVIAIAIAQVGYYFGIHAPVYNDQSRVYEDSQDAAFRSADFPAWTQVYVVADPISYHGYAREVMSFLRDDVNFHVVSPGAFTSDYMEQLMRGAGIDHAFFLLPGDTASLELVKEYFTVGDAQRSPFTLPPDREFWLYYAAYADNPLF